MRYARLLGFFALLAVAGGASAVTPVLVDPSLTCTGRTAGVDCFATIQDAVNNAGPAPAVVEVLAGPYAESVDISLMGSAIPEAPGDLTIEGVGAGNVDIDPPGGSRAITNSVSPFPGSVTLRNLRATSVDRDAIHLEGVTGDLLLETIHAGGAGFDGVDLQCDGTITLRQSNFDGNGNDGAQICSGGDLIIEDCTANDNIGAFEGDDGFNLRVVDGNVTILRSRAERNGGEGFEIGPKVGDTTESSGRILKVTIIDSLAHSNGRRSDPPAPGESCCDVRWNDYPNTIMADGFQIESCGVPFAHDGINENDFPFGTVAGDPGTIGDVEIVNTNAINNTQDGFEIFAFGAVTLTDVRSETNGFLEAGDGIQLNRYSYLENVPNENPRRETVGATAVVGQRLTVLGNADDGIMINGGRGSTEPFENTSVTLVDVIANQNGRSIPFNLGFPPPADLWESLLGAGDNLPTGGSVHAEEGIDTADVSRFSCTRCTANENGHSGMSINADIIVGNVLRSIGNRETGMELLADTSLECFDCVSNRNGEHGFHARGGTILIDGCEASFSAAQDGLDVAGGFRPPDPDETPTPGMEPPVTDIVIRNCLFVGNHEQGMDAHAVRGDDTGSATFENICAAENGIGAEIQGNDVPLTVTNSQFLANRLHGIRFERNLVSQSISGSNMVGNGRSGLFLDEVPDTDVLSAGNNWWGDPSGPTDPTDNPGGSGDAIFDASNAVDPVNGGNGIVDFNAPAGQPFESAFSCDSPTPTPTSTPSSTPSDTPTQTPTATPSSTPTVTAVPDGGACDESSRCEAGAECVNNVCVRGPTPAPTTSFPGLLAALVGLLAIAGIAMARRWQVS